MTVEPTACGYWRPCPCANCLPDLLCYSCGAPQSAHAAGEHLAVTGVPSAWASMDSYAEKDKPK